jgi:hypothetical protein
VDHVVGLEALVNLAHLREDRGRGLEHAQASNSAIARRRRRHLVEDVQRAIETFDVQLGADARAAIGQLKWMELAEVAPLAANADAALATRLDEAFDLLVDGAVGSGHDCVYRSGRLEVLEDVVILGGQRGHRVNGQHEVGSPANPVKTSAANASRQCLWSDAPENSLEQGASASII